MKLFLKSRAAGSVQTFYVDGRVKKIAILSKKYNFSKKGE